MYIVRPSLIFHFSQVTTYDLYQYKTPEINIDNHIPLYSSKHPDDWNETIKIDCVD